MAGHDGELLTLVEKPKQASLAPEGMSKADGV